MLTSDKKLTFILRGILYLAFITPIFQACSVFNPNRMLKADKNYVGTTFLDTVSPDFRITQGDVLNVLVFPKGGYSLIEPQIVSSNEVALQASTTSLSYTIDAKGEANLPIIGVIQLQGLTTREAEIKLTEAYSKNYIDPYVNVLVVNKFVTVYRGSSESRKVLLDRPDMTIIEAIGAAGGVPENGKAAKITVIRNINGTPQTQIIDLSEISGLQAASTYVQPNDIIYIEPVLNATVFRELAPIITTVSSIVVIYAFFVNLSK